MSTAELLQELKQLSNADRLLIIEAATRMVREDLSGDEIASREDRNQRLRAAALVAQDWYRPGGELTEWTVLDAEEFLDDYR